MPKSVEMEGDIVKLVVKWLSLRNRRGVLQGWMDNPRLQMDGVLELVARGLLVHIGSDIVIVKRAKAF